MSTEIDQSLPRGKALRRAVQEMYWAYIPFIVLAFVLTIFRQMERVPDMPDMMILASILFGESASKALRINTSDQEEVNSIHIFGIIAFVLSIVLWVLLLTISHGRVPELKANINAQLFYYACALFWLSSFVYSVYVRFRIHRNC